MQRIPSSSNLPAAGAAGSAPSAGDPPAAPQVARTLRPAGPGYLVPRRSPDSSPSDTAAQARPAPGRLTAGDERLAAYLTCRAAVGRPVDAAEHDVLKRANDSVEDVRNNLLPWGRGNVMRDLQKTESLTGALGMAAEQLDAFPRLGKGIDARAEKAGTAAYIGAATCNAHAAAVEVAHGQALRAGEVVTMVGVRKPPHVFAVTTTSDHLNVVLDPWSDGPAVNIEDAHHPNATAGLLGPMVDPEDITPDNAPQAAAAFRRGFSETGPALSNQVSASVQSTLPIFRSLNPRHGETNPELPHHYAHPPSVVSQPFADDAKKALDSVKTPDGLRVPPDGGTPPSEWKTSAARVLAPVSNTAAATVREQVLRDHWREVLTSDDPQVAAQAEVLRNRSEVLNSVQAFGAARSLGADQATAVDAAPRIAEAAKNLRADDPSRPAASRQSRDWSTDGT
jgi:hypothetical protein